MCEALDLCLFTWTILVGKEEWNVDIHKGKNILKVWTGSNELFRIKSHDVDKIEFLKCDLLIEVIGLISLDNIDFLLITELLYIAEIYCNICCLI